MNDDVTTEDLCWTDTIPTTRFYLHTLHRRRGDDVDSELIRRQYKSIITRRRPNGRPSRCEMARVIFQVAGADKVISDRKQIACVGHAPACVCSDLSDCAYGWQQSILAIITLIHLCVCVSGFCMRV